MNIIDIIVALEHNPNATLFIGVVLWLFFCGVANVVQAWRCK